MKTTKKISDFAEFQLKKPELVKGGTTGTYCGPNATVNYGYGSTSGMGPNGGTGTAYYGAAQIAGANGNTVTVGGAVGTTTGANGTTVVGAVGGIIKH